VFLWFQCESSESRNRYLEMLCWNLTKMQKNFATCLEYPGDDYVVIGRGDFLMSWAGIVDRSSKKRQSLSSF
jgi:hypothetical protein